MLICTSLLYYGQAWTVNSGHLTTLHLAVKWEQQTCVSCLLFLRTHLSQCVRSDIVRDPVQFYEGILLLLKCMSFELGVTNSNFIAWVGNLLKFLGKARNGLKLDGLITVFQEFGIKGYWDLKIGDSIGYDVARSPGLILYCCGNNQAIRQSVINIT